MYESFGEITGQSEALRLTLRNVSAESDSIRQIIRGAGDVLFVGCGSSYWLSLSASKTFSLKTGNRAFVFKAGDVIMNPEEHASIYKNPVLICPSRSGSSTEQIEAIDAIRRVYGDVPVLSAVVYEDSELEKRSKVCLRLPWAGEKSVCQTRSFSCLYMSMLGVAAMASGEDGFYEDLMRYADIADDLLKENMPRIREIVDGFSSFDKLITLGSGRQYGVAIEGAYIGIEMAQFNANYYSLMELRHGPIVTVNENTLVALVSNGKSRELEENMARDAGRHGGKVIAVTDRGRFHRADWTFEMGGEYPPEAVALYFVQLMQAFAYWEAVKNELDPDHPGDLVPFIKL